MGQAVPTQHPAAGAPVVIPSNHNLLRALLAFAAIAIVGLTVAVVILANDGDEVTTSQPSPSAEAEAAPTGPRAIHAPGQRYDGGPEEGTRGIVRSTPQLEVNPSTGYPTTRYDGGPEEGTRGAVGSTSPLVSRYDGGPEEGTRGPGR